MVPFSDILQIECKLKPPPKGQMTCLNCTEAPSWRTDDLPELYRSPLLKDRWPAWTVPKPPPKGQMTCLYCRYLVRLSRRGGRRKASRQVPCTTAAAETLQPEGKKACLLSNLIMTWRMLRRVCQLTAWTLNILVKLNKVVKYPVR